MVFPNTLIVIIPLVIKQDVIATTALDKEECAFKNRETDQHWASLGNDNGQWRKHRQDINNDSGFFTHICS